MGNDSSAVPADELADVPPMLTGEVCEPLAHQLLREAWNLRHSNPRASDRRDLGGGWDQAADRAARA